MKYSKVIISFILTILFLYIASNNAMNRPSFYSASQNGYSIEYLSTPKVFEKEPYSIEIKIIGQLSDNIFPVVRKSKPGQDFNTDIKQYEISKMKMVDSATQTYSFAGMGGIRGDRIHYYFELHDSLGMAKVTLTPEAMKPYPLKYIGHVPLFILVSHIFLIFFSVFLIILATIYAISFLQGSADLSQVAKYTLYAAIACFLGGYPFGFAMNWYAFNGFWEGVPFGTDATDNKTQLLFVYLLFATIAMLGTLRKKPEKDLYSPKTTGYIAAGSFLIMTFVNLIPHSIQFSKFFTKAFCYSFIGIVFIFTIYPVIQKRISK